jgi:hypothetical protein
MNPFKAILAGLFARDCSVKPANTVRLAIEHLDERSLPSVSPLNMASPHEPIEIKQIQVQFAPPAHVALNSATRSIDHPLEGAYSTKFTVEASEPTPADAPDGTYTIRFYDID